MLDLGRQIERADFLLDYAAFCKSCGYNTIVLYLEASVRTSVTSFFNPAQSYSLDELRSIVEGMESLGLDVIPAFENMFHMEKFFAYKELEHFSELTDEREEGRKLSPPHYKRGAAGCVTNPELLAFTDAYVREVCSVFHSPYVHMGMDEIFEFAECERCKQVLATGKTKQDLFYGLIMHNYELIRSLGREMWMWDDFFEYYDVVERLPRDIVFCNWNYFFMGNEPRGKWTGRTKRDWFARYEDLGFRYVFCSKATNVSSSYNIDALTSYAEKHAPFGAMMTTWERADCFYDGLKPAIAYGGKKWSGEISSEADKIALYASFLGGDEELSKLLLSISAPDFTFGYFDVTNVADGPYHVIEMYKKQLAYALGEFEKRELSLARGANPVLADIYDNLSEQYALLSLAGIGNEVFNAYEKGGANADVYEPILSAAETRFRAIAANGDALWARSREGIVSCCNSWKNHCAGNLALVEQIRTALRAVENQRFGIFCADWMLPDTYSMVKGEILVKYVGDDAETLVYNGSIKTGLTMFDVSGCYEMRYRMQARAIEYAIVHVYGEGDAFPTHFSYFDGTTKRDVVRVERLYGVVKDEQNVLSHGVAFAQMGYGDGEAHLNDMSLARIKSGIKLYFK